MMKRMQKMMFATLFALCFVTLLSPTAQASTTWDGQSMTEPDWQGTGFGGGEYVVRTAAELAWVFDDMAGSVFSENVSLEADIDLNGHVLPSELGSAGKFDGAKFYGNGYTISGVAVDRWESKSGLFGTIGVNSRVMDLTIEGTISNLSQGGILAAINNGTIENVHINCVVESETIFQFGGIVRLNDDYGTIIDSTVTSSFDFADAPLVYEIGGIAAENKGTIKGCAYTGDAITISKVVNNSVPAIGGIAGKNSGTILLSYSHVDLTGEQSISVGGIAGTNTGTITSCYSSGSVSSAAKAGGVVGENSGTVNTCLYLGSGAARGIGSGSGDTTAFSQLGVLSGGQTLLAKMNELSFAYNMTKGQDDYLANFFMEGSPYPVFYAHLQTWWTEAATLSKPAEVGGVYQIETPDELGWFLREINQQQPAYSSYDKDAILINDIDLSAHLWNSSTLETPSTTKYTGTFDGGGHTVSGMYSPKGFFNIIGAGGVVKNLNVSGLVVENLTVGGIAGENYGTIENVSFTGFVQSTSVRAGGIVGYNEGGVINNARFYGEIHAFSENSRVGGIVGWHYTGLVINCVNTGGHIWANAEYALVGGVVGKADAASTIANSYNLAAITSPKSSAGGIVGEARGTVNNVYNAGTIDSTSSAGGITSYQANEGHAVSNAHWMTGKGVTVGIKNSASGAQSSNITSFSAPSAQLVTTLNNARQTYSGIASMQWYVGAGGYPSFSSGISDPSGNGVMGTEDLALITATQNYNVTASDANYNPMLDLNADGKINFSDLAMARNSKYFGK